MNGQETTDILNVCGDCMHNENCLQNLDHSRLKRNIILCDRSRGLTLFHIVYIWSPLRICKWENSSCEVIRSIHLLVFWYWYFAYFLHMLINIIAYVKCDLRQ